MGLELLLQGMDLFERERVLLSVDETRVRPRPRLRPSAARPRLRPSAGVFLQVGGRLRG